jgi:phosphatidylglycerophosphate synthase
MKNPGIKALVADYTRTLALQELAGMWAVVVFFRLPGFVVAWVAITLGISATRLTLLGLASTVLIALAGVFLPVPAALVVIAVLAACFQILDCADGTVARATGTASLTGRFLDFASDILWRATCLATLGHVADRISPDATPAWLAIGLMAGFCATYARLMRCYVDTLPGADDAAGKTPTFRPTFGNLAFAFLSGLDQIIPLIAVAAWAFGALEMLLIFALIYHGADMLLAVQRAYATLQVRDGRKISRGPAL